MASLQQMARHALPHDPGADERDTHGRSETKKKADGK
jgi:hypothetical protein